MPIIEKVWWYCKQTEIFDKTITLKGKYADFKQVTCSRTVRNPIVQHGELARIGLELLEGIFPSIKGVRLLGISVSFLNEAKTPLSVS